MPTGTKIAAIVLVVLLGAAGLYYAFATPTSAPKFDATKGSGTTSTDGANNGSMRPNSLPPAGAGANGANTAGSSSTAPGLEALADRQRQLTSQSGSATGGTNLATNPGTATGASGTTTGTTTGTTGFGSPNNPNAPIGNTAPNGTASTGSTSTAPFKNGNMGFRGGPGTSTPAPTGLASNTGSTGSSLPETPGMKAGNPTTSTPAGTETASGNKNAANTATSNPTSSDTTASNGTYIVKKGDTMQTIAKQVLGSASKWEMLSKANPTVDPTRMKIGTKLRVPNSPMAASTDLASASTTTSASKVKGTPSNPTAATSSGMHTVVKGETLSSIARMHYGDSKFWKAIVKANPKVNEKNLAVGTKLAIPPKSAIADADKVTRGEG